MKHKNISTSVSKIFNLKFGSIQKFPFCAKVVLLPVVAGANYRSSVFNPDLLVEYCSRRQTFRLSLSSLFINI